MVKMISLIPMITATRTKIKVYWVVKVIKEMLMRKYYLTDKKLIILIKGTMMTCLYNHHLNSSNL